MVKRLLNEISLHCKGIIPSTRPKQSTPIDNVNFGKDISEVISSRQFHLFT